MSKIIPPTSLFEEIFELPLLSSIPVTKELLVEAGFDINTNWEDGRLHFGITKDPVLFDLKLVAPNGIESRFLTISLKEVRDNASEQKPYFKSISPLNYGAGEYKIKATMTTICKYFKLLPGNPNFLYSITPKLRFYVDGYRSPIVDVSYPSVCDGKTTILKEFNDEWPFIYMT